MPLVKEKVLDKNSSSLSAETFLFRATAAGWPLWRLHGGQAFAPVFGKTREATCEKDNKNANSLQARASGPAAQRSTW